MRSIVVLFVIAFTFSPAALSLAQTLPCGQRSTSRGDPWIQAGLACLEEPISDPAQGELGFTALAVAPDGTLYAARPLAGEVVAVTDSGGDGLPNQVQVIASGLTFPNGLDYHDGALYISGGAHVYRWQNGTLTTLVSDLPSGGGFWTGGIAVGDDGRIYVATGAPCDFCVSPDPARGAVLRFAPDGSDRRIIATGLREPTALTFMNGDLYVVDSARDGLFDTPDLDELDRVPLDQTDTDFGFPYCVGLHNTPDLNGFDCSKATPPVVAFPTASNPSALAVYRGTAIPSLEGKLLVVLSGSYNNLDLRGYAVVTVDPQAGTYALLMPNKPDNSPGSNFTLEQMSFRGSGFYPQRPLGVAVTEQGWVYISAGDGRILSLRP